MGFFPDRAVTVKATGGQTGLSWIISRCYPFYSPWRRLQDLRWNSYSQKPGTGCTRPRESLSFNSAHAKPLSVRFFITICISPGVPIENWTSLEDDIVSLGDRPGLLLMCHGEFPDGFLADEQHAELYNKCLFGLDLLCDSACYRRQSDDDVFTAMGMDIAFHLSSRLKLSHLELSYLRLKTPGIRQAIYRTASSGSHKVICAGASGLLVPGHGTSMHLPAELKKVMRDNPALDVTLAQPGISVKEAARLVHLSLGHAFNGPAARGHYAGDQDECLDDTGVVLICAHDYDAMDGMDSNIGSKYSSIVSMLSEMSKSSFREGGSSASSGYMHDVAASLKEYGSADGRSGIRGFCASRHRRGRW